MQFTPELTFAGGRVRPLFPEDRDALLRLYQQPELPGQRPLENAEPLDRMIELGVQMAATQSGMMWALETGTEGNWQLLGMVSAYDWQPSQLRVVMRVDGLPELGCELRARALATCMDFLASQYHTRNFSCQWIDGQNPAYPAMLESLGFKQTARMRDGWRTGEKTFVDVVVYHRVLANEAPDASRRAGE
jgi:RimJ/RimL family protein N-acetyltransferase